MTESSDHPSDERIRLAEEFIDAGKQLDSSFGPSAASSARGFETVVGKEEIRHALALAFAEFFSDEELEGLIAFYQSPLGKRMIEARTAVAPRLAKTVRDLYKGRFEEWASQILSEPDE